MTAHEARQLINVEAALKRIENRKMIQEKFERLLLPEIYEKIKKACADGKNGIYLPFDVGTGYCMQKLTCDGYKVENKHNNIYIEW